MNYQVLVELDSSNFDFSRAQPDGADLRFTNQNDNTLPYWIESYDSTSEKARIWVKVDSIPASDTTSIIMYYGNPTAFDASNGAATFVFFDDFETDTTGDYTWEHVDSGPPPGPISTYSWDPVNKWVHIITGDNSGMKVSRSVTLPLQGHFFISFRKLRDYPTDNVQRITIEQDENNYYEFIATGSGYDPVLHPDRLRKYIGGIMVDSSGVGGGVFIDSDTDHTIEGWYTNAMLQIDIDGVAADTLTATNTTQLYPVSFSFKSDQIDLYWYEIRIRTYTDPEPLVTIGEWRDSETDFIQGTVYFDSKNNPAGPGHVIEVFDAVFSGRIGTVITDENSRFEFKVSIDRTCFLIVTGFPEQRFEVKPGEDIEIIIKTEKRPKTPILSQSDIKFEPGSVIIVGVEANQIDGVIARRLESALSTWIGEADSRISQKVPDFKSQYQAVRAPILEQLESVDVVSDDENQERKGFFTVLVGGPEVNMATLRYNTRLSTRFVEDQILTNKWFIREPRGCLYSDSEYGIIALIPMYSQLDDSAIYTITGGDKRLCVLVVAGNGREGTYAAGLVLKKILQTGTEGEELLNELDNLLIWMVSGDEQTIQPVTVVVKYVDETTASIVEIMTGEDTGEIPCFGESIRAPEIPARKLQFETVAEGYYDGLDEKGTYVVRDSTDVENLRNKGYALPEIDFSGHMIIAVFQGTCPTGGFSITVVKVVETEPVVQVFVKETWPGEGCGVTEALTQPYHIIKVQRVEKEIVFTRGLEITICESSLISREEKGVLSGLVIDPDSGSGIPDAVVYLSQSGTGTTDFTTSHLDGGFTFFNLDPGTYSVGAYWKGRLTMESNSSSEGEVTVTAGETSIVPIELGSSGNHLEITSVNINGGAVITVSPGENIFVEIEYIYWRHKRCPDCIMYFPVGIESDPQDAISGSIPGLYPGSKGSGIVYLTAPSVPGTYHIYVAQAAVHNENQSFRTYKNAYPDKMLDIGSITVMKEINNRELLHRILVFIAAVFVGILVIWAFHKHEKKPDPGLRKIQDLKEELERIRK